MEKIISCCGLNCATCDARISTVNNDHELRIATAEKWKAAYKNEALLPEMINCTGCREEGAKFSHCTVCEIRNCANERGFNTCGECDKMDTCQLVSAIHKYVPEAVMNLRNLN